MKSISSETEKHYYLNHQGILGGSDGKESACNTGDPGSGGSLGERNGYPLQCSCLENSMNRGDWWATVHLVTASDTTEQLTSFFTFRPTLQQMLKELL